MQKLSKEQEVMRRLTRLNQLEYKIKTLPIGFKVFEESHETIGGPPRPFLVKSYEDENNV